MLFCFNDTATTEIYTLSLHDALPISGKLAGQYSYSSIYSCAPSASHPSPLPDGLHQTIVLFGRLRRYPEETFIEPFEVRRVTDEHAVFSGKILFQGRSEEHTSELQSRQYLVCSLLLEKKIYTGYCFDAR